LRLRGGGSIVGQAFRTRKNAGGWGGSFYFLKPMPNVEVNMGTHKVSDLTQANSATPWKDFSIALMNCPAFYGANPRDETGWSIPLNGSGIAAHGSASHQSNTIQVNLIGTLFIPSWEFCWG